MEEEYWTNRLELDGGGSHLSRRRSVRERGEANVVSSVTAEDEASGNGYSVRRTVKDSDLDDFSDVFGGPPRTLFSNSSLSREFDFDYRLSSSSCPSPDRNFYREVFVADEVERKVGGGRCLQAFKIPSARQEEFYDDVFGLTGEAEIWQTVKKPSKSSDAISKLRPMNCYSVWNSTTPMKNKEKSYEEDDLERSIYNLPRIVTSPETISLEPSSHPSNKASADDTDLNSPASSPRENGINLHPDEATSSYVIELNTDRKVGTDSIEEAIAWAKEKFQSHRFDIQPAKESSSDAEAETPPEEQNKKRQSVSIEMQLLDEDIKSWSAGKESNIRLLLSTLHLILWPSSGWYPIPFTCLKENSQVKKAYQRARLCLHPDKLQQRGVTFPQKYVAERAFPVLQESWNTFISSDMPISW